MRSAECPAARKHIEPNVVRCRYVIRFPGFGAFMRVSRIHLRLGLSSA
jgi:hypothetical protein